ncbi:MAG: hypothetical protein ACE5F3_06845, partial [Mariprofundaceae bacterium]
MPVDFVIDTKARVVFLRLWDKVSSDDFARYQRSCYSHDDFDPNFHELIDCSDLRLTDADFTKMIQVSNRDKWGAESRRAIVAPRTVIFGLAMMYKTLAGGKRG